VELKSEWPEPQRAARRLAGHANASRGEQFLWIIGVDADARAVTGARREEIANWFPKVTSDFDGVAPDMVWNGNVPYEDKVVVGMLFDSAQPPYVVTARTPEKEVPWREGNRTRSARRQDLLRMLLPTVRLPVTEAIRGEMHVDTSQPAQWNFMFRLSLELLVFFELPDTSPVTVPSHRSRATLRFTEGASISLPISFEVPGGHKDGPIRCVGEQMVANGSSDVYLKASRTFEQGALNYEGDCNVRVELRPSGTDRAVILDARFVMQQQGLWKLVTPGGAW